MPLLLSSEGNVTPEKPPPDLASATKSPDKIFNLSALRLCSDDRKKQDVYKVDREFVAYACVRACPRTWPLVLFELISVRRMLQVMHVILCTVAILACCIWPKITDDTPEK